MAEDTLVEGMDPVTAHYGYWPTFHDATVRRVEMDGETNALTIAFILNDAIDDRDCQFAHVIIKWHEVEKISLAADYSSSDQNWLCEMKFSRTGEWLDTELLANDGLGGTVRARRIEVTHFEPIAS